MNDIEKYEFDRLGYLVIKEMLTAAQVASLASAIDELEEHTLARIQAPPRKKAAWGHDYHANDERHYHAWGQRDLDLSREGKTLMIEDFWNAHSAFDLLLDHPRTLDYIREIVLGRYTINNSEGSLGASVMRPTAMEIADGHGS